MGSQDQQGRVSGPSRGVRVERPAPGAVERVEDPQSETVPAEPLFEVLAETPNGHRTVQRVRAGGQDAAVESLDPPDGVWVLKTAEAPSGLGSG
jgi:hypothetical protein